MQESNLTGWVAARWIALVLLALALPSTAMAQTPPDDQYGQPPGTQPTPTPTPGGTGQEQENEDDDESGDDAEDGGAGPGGDGGNGPGGASNDPGDVTATDLPLRDAEGGSLPFTGLDLSLVVLLGLLAVGAGFAIRAVQRRKTSPG